MFIKNIICAGLLMASAGAFAQSVAFSDKATPIANNQGNICVLGRLEYTLTPSGFNNAKDWNYQLVTQQDGTILSNYYNVDNTDIKTATTINTGTIFRQSSGPASQVLATGQDIKPRIPFTISLYVWERTGAAIANGTPAVYQTSVQGTIENCSDIKDIPLTVVNTPINSPVNPPINNNANGNGNGAQISSVPTTGSISLIMLAGLLGFFGAAQNRRKKS